MSLVPGTRIGIYEDDAARESSERHHEHTADRRRLIGGRRVEVTR